MKRFSKSHEYIQIEGDVATIGITNHAQEQLGDVVFIDLPDVGKTVSRGDEIAVVESVKAASEIYAPVSGEVVEVNEALGDTPGLVNEDAEGKAWFFRIKLSAPDEAASLMDEDAYKAHVA